MGRCQSGRLETQTHLKSIFLTGQGVRFLKTKEKMGGSLCDPSFPVRFQLQTFGTTLWPPLTPAVMIILYFPAKQAVKWWSGDLPTSLLERVKALVEAFYHLFRAYLMVQEFQFSVDSWDSINFQVDLGPADWSHRTLSQPINQGIGLS